MKHTSAPWRIGDAGLTVFGPPNGQPAPEVIASCKKRANARLIAAAPDLLEALEQCVTDPNAHCFASDEKEAMYRRLRAINETARAAIAKAKGE